jgi:MFS family permease
MTAGSILGVLLVLAWSAVRDLGTFFLIWALMGLCWSATLYSPAFATVTAFFRERRTEALTAVTLMAGLASTIFLPLGAWLVDRLGWRDALVALAAILAAATVLPHALVLRAPPPHDPVAESSLTLGEALRHRSFRWLVLGFVCFALGTGVNVHLVPYLVEHGHGAADAAVLAGLVGVAQVVGRILLVAFERRVALGVVLVGVYVLQPIALVLLLAGLPILFVALFGAGRGADTIVRNTLVARLYGPARFASIAAVLGAFVSLAWALGPFALGVLHDALGGYDVGLALVAGASAVTVLALWRGASAAG